jgi:hypothetical protein
MISDVTSLLFHFHFSTQCCRRCFACALPPPAAFNIRCLPASPPFAMSPCAVTPMQPQGWRCMLHAGGPPPAKRFMKFWCASCFLLPSCANSLLFLSCSASSTVRSLLFPFLSLNSHLHFCSYSLSFVPLGRREGHLRTR